MPAASPIRKEWEKSFQISVSLFDCLQSGFGDDPEFVRVGTLPGLNLLLQMKMKNICSIFP